MEAYSKMAKVYDELIYEDVNYEKIANFILNLCNKMAINKENYLDLACGTGNVAQYIGKNFKLNYLVDLSEEMLMEADKKLRFSKVKAKIICQDMCELNLNKKFDLITCVLDSTNYILEDSELEDYLEGVHQHLNENGVFVLDINSYYKLSEVLGNNIYTYSTDEVFYSWENVFEDDIVDMDLTFFVKNGELYERFNEFHQERAYKEEFLEKKFKNAGFIIKEKYNGYSEEKVLKNTERIVYVLTKSLGYI
ncbi:Methyltransferase domain-containing protein [Clostridium cavendishii DSM 21758]|uniref:Methyltransferase domain-containing protein n=1 Tax=Clostridium cavendishii DSM 21758 TaxID=1121302 RepID=A0A1M6KYP1_9CLOT|nr:class I SAM-dependent methyltransferase [Clostridium cavendishii]SHJ64014.1 Methyltransferase domain-containing protein [Clostridium cavendishii DSM 21758]